MVVSTVLVQGLAVLLILLLAQLAFASHVRTMSVSAASEGARRGGLLGGDEAGDPRDRLAQPEDGHVRVHTGQGEPAGYGFCGGSERIEG